MLLPGLLASLCATLNQIVITIEPRSLHCFSVTPQILQKHAKPIELRFLGVCQILCRPLDVFSRAQAFWFHDCCLLIAALRLPTQTIVKIWLIGFKAYPGTAFTSRCLIWHNLTTHSLIVFCKPSLRTSQKRRLVRACIFRSLLV